MEAVAPHDGGLNRLGGAIVMTIQKVKDQRRIENRVQTAAGMIPPWLVRHESVVSARYRASHRQF